jgi:amino acid transporter
MSVSERMPASDAGQMGPAARAESHELKHGAMGTLQIVFLVVATAAPLTAMVTGLPVSVALGNGVGVPGTYLLVGLVLALFAVGYAAMSERITNAGAFYAYVRAAFGRRLGIAAGLVAIVAYNALVLYVVGLIGFFAHNTFVSELSLDIPWEVFGFVFLTTAFVLGVLGVEVNARVLAVFLFAETALLVAFVIGMLVVKGPGTLDGSSFDPSRIFSGAAGIAFMFTFTCFIGFEATAIFGEEAKDPHRTVPRATLLAIAFIGVLYLVVSWAIVSVNGGDQAQAVAGKDPGNYTIAAIQKGLGSWSSHLVSWLLLTSLVAVLIAVHNMASRYFFAFGREGVLPRQLGMTHPSRKTPHVAATLQYGLTLVIAGAYAVTGSDPYLNLGSQMAGVGTLGVIALMAATSVAVPVYYLRNEGRPHWWTHVAAPVLAAAGLLTACVLVIRNYPLLTGSTSDVVNRLPYVLVLAAVIGAALGGVGSRRGDVSALDHSTPETVPSG